MDIFLEKHIDALEGAFIHPPKPSAARLVTNARDLFDDMWTIQLQLQHAPTTTIQPGIARTTP